VLEESSARRLHPVGIFGLAWRLFGYRAENQQPVSIQEERLTSFIRSKITGLTLAIALSATPSLAETISFKAELKGASEVPPTTSSGTGNLTATYDTTSKKLSWKGNVSGLSGNATAAHFHGPAEPGKNAAVMVPAPGTTTGAFEGTATLTDEQAKALTAGQTYFNVHTVANPNGELRGQVEVAK
jgi:hypothetical protein